MDCSTLAVVSLLALAAILMLYIKDIVTNNLHRKHQVNSRDAQGRFKSNIIRPKDLL